MGSLIGWPLYHCFLVYLSDFLFHVSLFVSLLYTEPAQGVVFSMAFHRAFNFFACECFSVYGFDLLQLRYLAAFGIRLGLFQPARRFWGIDRGIGGCGMGLIFRWAFGRAWGYRMGALNTWF